MQLHSSPWVRFMFADYLSTSIAVVNSCIVRLAGICYRNGTGVAKNEAEAVRLFTLAADQGNAAAQFTLGKIYVCGLPFNVHSSGKQLHCSLRRYLLPERHWCRQERGGSCETVHSGCGPRECSCTVHPG